MKNMFQNGLKLRSAAMLFGAGLMLSGCGVWLGEEEDPPLPGDRLSILLIETDLEPDPRLSDLQIKLPAPYLNKDWPQHGGYPDHAMHHLEAGELSERWRVDIGDGGNDRERILGTPIVVNDIIYVNDADYQVTALNAETGEEIWQIDVKVPSEDEEAFGGGLAYHQGVLYLTTGFAELIALNAADGSEIWRKTLPGPVRSAPAVSDEAVIAISIDNQTIAFDPTSGDVKWKHAGFSESAGVIGGATAAISKNLALVPYSSGDVFALRLNNGRIVWSDSLISLRRSEALSALADVRGAPVIDRGVVYAVSQSGRMVALDLRNGGRIWDRRVGGINTPWIAGDFLYVLANDGHLVAMTRRGGRVLWLQSLPIWEDPENQTDSINWVGPILAGDRLILGNSNGEVITVSPYTGEVLGKLEVSGSISLPPIVANGSVYILSDSGDLYAYK